MKEKKEGKPFGIGVSESEMSAMAKRIADKVAERIIAAIGESFRADPRTGDIMIPLGELFDE
jgi:hypothetical protein